LFKLNYKAECLHLFSFIESTNLVYFQQILNILEQPGHDVVLQ